MIYKRKGYAYTVDSKKLSRPMFSGPESFVASVSRIVRYRDGGPPDEFEPGITEIHAKTEDEAVKDAREEADAWIDRHSAASSAE